MDFPSNSKPIKYLNGLKSELDQRFATELVELRKNYDRQIASLEEMGRNIVGEEFAFEPTSGAKPFDVSDLPTGPKIEISRNSISASVIASLPCLS